MASSSSSPALCLFYPRGRLFFLKNFPVACSLSSILAHIHYRLSSPISHPQRCLSRRYPILDSVLVFLSFADFSDGLEMFKVLGKLDIRSGSNNMNIAQRAIFDYASRHAYAIPKEPCL